jgi:hypothetical protein
MGEHVPNYSLRDNDLKNRLRLSTESAYRVKAQLKRDSNFLASLDVMDYRYCTHCVCYCCTSLCMLLLYSLCMLLLYSLCMLLL